MRLIGPLILAPLLLLQTACTTIPVAHAEPAASLTIASGGYQEAYDAALVVLREEGFAAAMRDPRAGIIETEPLPCPTVFEPWATHAAPSSSTAGNTINHRRRRVQFEFTPLSAAAEVPADSDPLGLKYDELDLTRSPEPLQLTVRVWLEQAHHPGLRRNTWSRRATSQSSIHPQGDTAALPRVIWSTVSRDPVAEDAILRRLAETLPETNS